ncbi:hypothetical protein ASG36_06460 [Geodermatophilus sp. Leaf369]|nr:hypothetical protein ASG36_06460 [Geodermatophilus sp. Leaf369]
MAQDARWSSELIDARARSARDEETRRVDAGVAGRRVGRAEATADDGPDGGQQQPATAEQKQQREEST